MDVIWYARFSWHVNDLNRSKIKKKEIFFYHKLLADINFSSKRMKKKTETNAPFFDSFSIPSISSILLLISSHACEMQTIFSYFRWVQFFSTIPYFNRKRNICIKSSESSELTEKETEKVKIHEWMTTDRPMYEIEPITKKSTNQTEYERYVSTAEFIA